MVLFGKQKRNIPVGRNNTIAFHGSFFQSVELFFLYNHFFLLFRQNVASCKFSTGITLIPEEIL